MRIDGQCHCGEIAYEGEAAPDSVVLCHCADCQAMSGTAYRANIPVPASSFKLNRGTPRTYIRTADIGNSRMHAFCGTCGCHVWSCAPKNAPYYALRTGTVAQRSQFTPRRQIWRQSAMPWADDLTVLEAREHG